MAGMDTGGRYCVGRTIYKRATGTVLCARAERQGCRRVCLRWLEVYVVVCCSVYLLL